VTAPTPDPDEERYGFRWGPLVVQRAAILPSRNGETHVVRITTATGKSINVYVSPTGRSVRVFSNGKEWTP
jgi:hypothetical protein